MANDRRGAGSLLLHGSIVSILVAICGTASAQSPAGGLTQLQVVSEKYGLRGIGQSVAIIDSGIAYNHLALGGGLGANFRVVGGKDFTGENDANPYDDPSPLGGHGTRVSSVVGMAEGSGGGAVGVAPGADLVGLRIFDDAGAAYFSWLETALQWVHNNRNAFEFPITTVNLSLGAAWNSNTVPTWSTIENELSQLKADGIFIAASAGNNFTSYNQPGLSYPAASPNVVPVMSVDDDSGQLSFFSQRHARAIGAPGRLIDTAVPDYAGDNDGVVDDFELSSGTDIASPFLAGASVIVREAFQFVGTSNVTQQMIYDQMMNTADTIFDPVTNANYSRLNIEAAIDALMPADDFGNTAATATNLGTVSSSKPLAGLVGTVADVDYFAFTAGNSGTARLQTAATYYLAPQWTIRDDFGLTIQGAADVSFPVIFGRRYTLGLATTDAIGYFNSTLSIGSTALLGDYNRNGAVDAADYAIWRDTRGSTSDLRADGSVNGVIDTADFNVWKLNFGRAALSASVPEPTTAAHFLILTSAVCGLSRRLRSRPPLAA